MVNHFEFQRFKPDTETALFANAMLLQIHDYIADGGVTEAIVMKTDDGYECRVRVFSHGSVLSEDHHSMDAKKAVERTGEGMKKKLVGNQVKNLHVDDNNFWNFTELHVT